MEAEGRMNEYTYTRIGKKVAARKKTAGEDYSTQASIN
jgi:hypothetical protein